MTISSELKRQCVEMKRSGQTAREIYFNFFCRQHPGMAYETFRTKLKRWQKQPFADEMTLNAGTYEGFIAHNATVQVNADGEVVQAWIKQTAEDDQMARLLDFIKENTTPVMVRPQDMGEAEPEMLEIPLFDQHFPQNDHISTYVGLVPIIESKVWEEINIIIGQDMLHNDGFRGCTSSGRPIEQVDMVEGWALARIFYSNLVGLSLRHAKRVKIIYSKGNHDESMSWAFVQMLQAMFPEAEVDDSLRQRKCISWRECFIGITHGAYKKSGLADLRGQFTIQFAPEFASAKVREIHAGHLHREEERDVYGVMVRRLSHSGIEDDWTDDEGLVGANRRFMVFRWKPGRLAGIDYI